MQALAPAPSVPDSSVTYLTFSGHATAQWKCSGEGTMLCLASDDDDGSSPALLKEAPPSVPRRADRAPVAMQCLHLLSPGQREQFGGPVGCLVMVAPTSESDDGSRLEFRLSNPTHYSLCPDVTSGQESDMTDINSDATRTVACLNVTDSVCDMEHEAGPMHALFQHRRLVHHMTLPDKVFDASTAKQRECAICADNIATRGCRDLPGNHPRYGTDKTICTCFRRASVANGGVIHGSTQDPHKTEPQTEMKPLYVCASNAVAVVCVPCGHAYACGSCALQTSVAYQHLAHLATSAASMPPPVACHVCAAPVWHYVSLEQK